MIDAPEILGWPTANWAQVGVVVAILISFAAGLISLAAYRRGGANIVVDAKIAMQVLSHQPEDTISEVIDVIVQNKGTAEAKIERLRIDVKGKGKGNGARPLTGAVRCQLRSRASTRSTCRSAARTLPSGVSATRNRRNSEPWCRSPASVNDRASGSRTSSHSCSDTCGALAALWTDGVSVEISRFASTTLSSDTA